MLRPVSATATSLYEKRSATGFNQHRKVLPTYGFGIKIYVLWCLLPKTRYTPWVGTPYINIWTPPPEGDGIAGSSGSGAANRIKP